MDDAMRDKIVEAGEDAALREIKRLSTGCVEFKCVQPGGCKETCGLAAAWATHIARACLSALAAAGYILLPAEMTEEQARRSLNGHALADRIRDGNPEHFALLVASRRATWRQMVAEMREGGDG